MTAATEAAPPSWTAGVAGALACGFVAAIGFGLNAPLFALTLDDRGIEEAVIGLFVTVTGVAALLATPAVPWLMGRFRVKTILIAALLISAALFLIYGLTPTVAGWAAIRFAFAATLTLLFVTSEAWLLELTPAHLRGRLLGAYAATFAGGFGVGGLILTQTGHVGWPPLLAASGAALLALPILLLRAPQATRPEGDAAKPSALWARITAAPILFVPPVAMGAIETALFNLLPLWSRRTGFEDSVAGLLIAAAALGNVVLQGPIGLLADRYGRTRVLIGVALIGIAGPFALAAATTPMAAYAALFVWSGSVTAFYTLGLVGIGQRFGAAELAGANAAFAASYGLGQLVAPIIGGSALQAGGPNGLMLALSVMALAPLAAVLADRRARKP